MRILRGEREEIGIREMVGNRGRWSTKRICIREGGGCIRLSIGCNRVRITITCIRMR
jgi:hypothetical protein